MKIKQGITSDFFHKLQERLVNSIQEAGLESSSEEDDSDLEQSDLTLEKFLTSSKISIRRHQLKDY